MNISDIVRKYLTDNGFDGLCGAGCGCHMDDICPCGGEGNFLECIPGHEHINENGDSIFTPTIEEK